jgi:tryptophanyl-tRNA synthetase
MRANYLGGNYGYGHAKNSLLELILNKFSTERQKYNELMEDKSQIDKALEIGASKARIIAHETLKRVRNKVGY